MMDTPNTESVIDHRIQTGTLKPGEIINQKYRIVSMLGKGGMGTVYKVEQLSLHVTLALKTLDERRVVDSILVKRFENEAQASFALHHPNLVRVHDYGFVHTGQPYLAMDFVEGITLEAYIKSKGRLQIEEAQMIFEQICNGLSYAHSRGVVHRDIKPGNIMLSVETASDVGRIVKILDFGIAKIMTPDGSQLDVLTRTGEIFGSPLYMSPEQCMGGAIDARSDIYSLGCVLFEALSGSPPMVGPNALRTMMMHQSSTIPSLKEAALGHEFPASAERMVAKMLAKRPGDRYRNLDEVAADLQNISKSEDRSFAKVSHPPANLRSAEKFKSSTYVASLIATALISAAISHFVTKATMQVKSADVVAERHPEIPIMSPLSTPLKEANPALSDLISTSKVAFDKAKPITSTYLTRNGEKHRIVHFPSSSIGSAAAQHSEVAEKQAQNDFEMGADENLILRLSGSAHPNLLKNIDIYKKIGPSEVSTFVYEGVEQFAISTIVDDSASDEPALGKLMSYARDWRNLIELTIKTAKIEDSTIETICRFPNLHSLALFNCTLNTELLSKHKSFLQKLDLLLFESKDEASSVINALQNSPKLCVLGLAAPDITPQNVTKLETCANLIELRLTGKGIGTSVLTAAMKLPHLIRFEVSSNLNREQIEIILANKKLVEIRLSNATIERNRQKFQIVDGIYRLTNKNGTPGAVIVPK